jgi:hypothetical protein
MASGDDFRRLQAVYASKGWYYRGHDSRHPNILHELAAVES